MTIAFNDIFRLMSWVFAAALLLVPFCRPIMVKAAAPADSH